MTIHFSSVTKALNVQDLILNSILSNFEKLEEVKIFNLKYNRFTLFNKLAHDWTFTDAITENWR
jgi:hypothetical protein